MVKQLPHAATVLRCLDAGWTVARIVKATGWPRRQVELLAANAGMLRRPALDTWVPARPAPERATTGLDELLRQADAGTTRTRALAGRVRHYVLELETAVTADASRSERDGYDAAEVRRWARLNGFTPPSHGRYLPKHIVEAWRAAQS